LLTDSDDSRQFEAELYSSQSLAIGMVGVGNPTDWARGVVDHTLALSAKSNARSSLAIGDLANQHLTGSVSLADHSLTGKVYFASLRLTVAAGLVGRRLVVVVVPESENDSAPYFYREALFSRRLGESIRRA
jgi:hypothetical protein